MCPVVWASCAGTVQGMAYPGDLTDEQRTCRSVSSTDRASAAAGTPMTHEASWWFLEQIDPDTGYMAD